MKKIKNRKLEFLLSSLIEFTEFTIMGLIGYFAMKVKIEYILIILLTFFISRFAIKKPQHYKIVSYFDGGWRRCVSWTTSLLLSMFLASKIELLVGILFTIFSVFTISTKGNIRDLTLGYKKKKEDGKYYDIEEFIKYNLTNSNLIDFEENLKRKDGLLFLIYKYRFKDKLSFSQISEKLDGMENVRIVEKLDQIALAIRISCGI